MSLSSWLSSHFGFVASTDSSEEPSVCLFVWVGKNTWRTNMFSEIHVHQTLITIFQTIENINSVPSTNTDEPQHVVCLFFKTLSYFSVFKWKVSSYCCIYCILCNCVYWPDPNWQKDMYLQRAWNNSSETGICLLLLKIGSKGKSYISVHLYDIFWVTVYHREAFAYLVEF